MPGQLRKLHLIPHEDQGSATLLPRSEDDRIVRLGPWEAAPEDRVRTQADSLAFDYADYDQAAQWPLDDGWLDAIVRFAHRRNDRNSISVDDLLKFRDQTEQLSREYFSDCDLIVAYGRAAIPAIVAAVRPYIAVVSRANPPKTGDDEQRLIALAREEAPAVIATDSASLRDLRRAGAPPSHFVPPILDASIWRPGSHQTRRRLRRRITGGTGRSPRFVLWAPSLHDWRTEDIDRLLGAVGRWLQQQPTRAARRFRLALHENGPDLDHRRELVDSHGLAASVWWARPSSQEESAELYRGADLVVSSLDPDRSSDNILLRASAAGVDVAGAYDDQWLSLFGAEHPPVRNVSGDEGFIALLSEMAGRPDQPNGPISPHAADWYVRHFSKAATMKRLDAIAEAIVDAPNAEQTSGFHSLRQKRWELRYEAASVDDYDAKYHRGVAYQVMDQTLSSIIREHMSLESPRILDLGCGPGSLMPCLAQIPGAKLTGVDLSPEMIAAARRRYPDVDFHVGDAEAIEFADGAFDVVLCSGVLHHLPTLDPTLREIRRVLASDGIFVAREPNADNFSRRHPEVAFAHLSLKHFLHFATDTATVQEPEAHDYHRDFEFAELVESVASELHVERLHTDLRVSYFYEMFDDLGDYTRIAELENTLSEHPGLNIVVVARNAESGAGVGPGARATVDALSERSPIPLEHFCALFDFTDAMAEQHLPCLHFDAAAYQRSGWLYLAEAIQRADRVLISSDLENFVAETAAALGLVADVRILNGAIPRAQRRTVFKSIRAAAVQPAHHRSMDMCLIQINGLTTSRELRTVSECCRHYGLIHLESGRHAAMIADAEDENWLQTTPYVCATRDRSTGAFRALVAPMLYSPLDVYKAAVVALQVEYDLDDDGAALKSLRRRIETRLGELENAGVYSHLAAIERGETLASLFKPPPTRRAAAAPATAPATAGVFG